MVRDQISAGQVWAVGTASPDAAVGRGLPSGSEHEQRYQELRRRVERRHEAVTALDGDDPGLVPAVDQLVEAVDELIAFEDRLPVLRDLPARALSVQVVRAGALAALLGGVLLGLGIWQNALPWRWLWLSIVLITVMAALRMVTLPVAPAAGEHRRQRYVAAGCGVTGLLIGPVAAMAPWWWPGLAVAVVHAVCLGVLLELLPPRKGRLDYSPS